MHHRLVRLVLEVRVPSRLELGSGPLSHGLKLLLVGSNLNTCLDTIRGKGASSLDVPLIENTLLDFRMTTSEVVK